VSQFALGAAIGAIRERYATEDGRPTLAELQLLMAKQPELFPHIRGLVADLTRNPSEPFDDCLRLILRGIAESRGETWTAIEAELHGVHRAPGQTDGRRNRARPKSRAGADR
jgi:hypothetical protein